MCLYVFDRHKLIENKRRIFLRELTSETIDKVDSGLIHRLDNKIQTLVKTKNKLEKSNHLATISPITAKDLSINISEELLNLKAIHREKLLEDLSTILNDKIKEVELKEKEEKQKDIVLNELHEALNEKIKQLEIANQKLEQEKQTSQELNSKLEESLKKLREVEKEIKIERDWLAEQVEQKSFEVLNTIDQLIKTEKNLTK